MNDEAQRLFISLACIGKRPGLVFDDFAVGDDEGRGVASAGVWLMGFAVAAGGFVEDRICQG